MAGGLTTAAVRERKGTGKQVGRDGEAAEEFELALAEPCGLGTFGCDLHTCNNTCRRREVKPFFGNAKIGSDQERGGGNARRVAVIESSWNGLFVNSEAAEEMGSVKSFV
jgi:hypothetical protein